MISCFCFTTLQLEYKKESSRGSSHAASAVSSAVIVLLLHFHYLEAAEEATEAAALEATTSPLHSTKRPPNKAREINDSMIDNAINSNAPIRRTGTIIEGNYHRQSTIPIAQPNLDLVQNADYQYPGQAKPLQIYSEDSNT